MSFLVVLLALGGAARLSVDTDSTRMLEPDLAFQQRAHSLNAAFPQLKGQLLVVISAPGEDAAIAATAGLANALAKRSDAFEWSFAPAADPWLTAHGLMYLDLAVLDERLARLSKSANLLARLRSTSTIDGFLAALGEATELAESSGVDLAALDPFYRESAAVLAAARRGEPRNFQWQAAMSGAVAEPEVLLVSAGPKMDFTALNPAKAALGAMGDAIASLDPSLRAEVGIAVTGDPALRADELRSVRKGIILSLTLSLVLVAVILRLALGSLPCAGLALGALVMTLVVTAGFASLAVGALNLISVAFVVLMVGLGIDFAIHFLAHYNEQSSDSTNPEAALIATGRSIGTAMILSALTTALAFLAFATTDFAGMAQLGLIGGAGVMIALAVAMTAIPAVITIWPSVAGVGGPRPLPMPSTGVRRLAGIAVIVAALGLAVLAPQARFDADPMNLRDPQAPSVLAYEILAGEPDRAPMRLSLLAQSGAEAKTLADRVEGLAEVRRATWLGDLIPEDQQAKLDLIDLAYPSILHAVKGPPATIANADPETLVPRLAALGTPAAVALSEEMTSFVARRDQKADEELAARLFRYFPALIDRLALQLEAGPIAEADLPAALKALYVAPDGQYRVEIMPEQDIRDPAALRSFTTEVAGLAPGAAGPPDQIAGASDAVAWAILQAAGLALVGCALLAWLTLGHIGCTAAILVPLVLSALATMGAVALSGMAFNYANVIVVPLMIGIGIDSGVHLALRAQTTSKHVFETSTPRAVFFSALTTVAAFGTLSVSDHQGTASMGMMLAMALAISVAVIFALTPSLVRRTLKR